MTDIDDAPGCWRTTPEGRAAQAALQAWVNGLDPEGLAALGIKPPTEEQAARLERIRERARARREG